MKDEIRMEDWEFRVPITISIVSHSPMEYVKVLKLLGTISKEDVYKAFKKALFEGKERLTTSVWVNGDPNFPEEGAYLRELTYDEKYGGKQTEEIPIPLWIDDEK